MTFNTRSAPSTAEAARLLVFSALSALSAVPFSAVEQRFLCEVMPTAYTVYVIELSRKVFNEDRKFREANPQYNGVLECLYVGQTSKTPQERLKQHKTGYRNAKGQKLSSNIVEKYGRYLRPSLYQYIGPLSRAEALEVELGLALELRRKGYAVWTN